MIGADTLLRPTGAETRFRLSSPHPPIRQVAGYGGSGGGSTTGRNRLEASRVETIDFQPYYPIATITTDLGNLILLPHFQQSARLTWTTAYLISLLGRGWLPPHIRGQVAMVGRAAAPIAVAQATISRGARTRPPVMSLPGFAAVETGDIIPSVVGIFFGIHYSSPHLLILSRSARNARAIPTTTWQSCWICCDKRGMSFSETALPCLIQTHSDEYRNITSSLAIQRGGHPPT